MSGNAKRRRPRPEKRQVQVRTSCGYSHWWWPSPPSPGQHCICGEKVWSIDRPDSIRWAGDKLEANFYFEETS